MPRAVLPLQRLTGGLPRLVVVAAAGWGKTSALRAALPAGTAWCSGVKVAADPAVLDDAARNSEWVVVDDLPVLSPGPAAELARAVVDVPAAVALVSRVPLPTTFWPGAGLGPGDLALSYEQTAALLGTDGGRRPRRRGCAHGDGRLAGPGAARTRGPGSRAVA